MPNITSILNDEIRRLARREITAATKVVRKATAQYRRDIASLKREVAALGKAIGFLETQEKRRVVQQPVAATSAEDVRFRADGLRTLRKRLGLSAGDFGLLVGVTGQTIYDWEATKSRPRKEQVSKLVAVRGIGKREAMKRLELLGVRSDVQRTTYSQTAEEFIAALVKSQKSVTGAEINAAWTKSGRPGKADNTITRMVKIKKLIRTKNKGERGSTYSAG